MSGRMDWSRVADGMARFLSRDADELVDELNAAVKDEARTAYDLGRDEAF